MPKTFLQAAFDPTSKALTKVRLTSALDVDTCFIKGHTSIMLTILTIGAVYELCVDVGHDATQANDATDVTETF